MRRVTGVLAAAVLLAAGCTGGPAAVPSPTATTGISPSPSASPEAPPPPLITLVFGGDVHFEGRVLRLLNDTVTTFGPVAEMLRSADFAMVNLETAVTRRGTPAPKEFVFRAPETAFDAIKAAGIDVVSLANNHGMDYGPVGLEDTIKAAAEAGVPMVGVGENAKAAHTPWITTIKGVRIAVLAYTQVNPYPFLWTATASRAGLASADNNAEISAAAEDVRAARKLADVVIVYMHWGGEREPCPREEQRRTARALADAGATLVVGAHAHILQGNGWLDGTFVAYSLGNFLWYSNTSNPDTGLLRVTLRGPTIAETGWIPAKVHPTIGQPIPVYGSERSRILDKIESLRACSGLAASRP